MKMSQQDVLRHVMKTLGWRREDLAQDLGISRRRLDSWLLPDTSKGFRPMDQFFHNQVLMLLHEEQIKSYMSVSEATISPAIPVVRSELFGFEYPTLFRITYVAVDGLAEDLSKPDVSRNRTGHSYALTNDPSMKPMFGNGLFMRAEPLVSRNTPLDSGWVFINEHRSLDRMDSFMRAVFMVMGESSSFATHFYTMNGRYFTLHQTAKPADFPNALDVVTVYNSDYYLNKTTPFGMFEYVSDDSCMMLFDRDGKQIEWGEAFGVDDDVDDDFLETLKSQKIGSKSL